MNSFDNENTRLNAIYSREVDLGQDVMERAVADEKHMTLNQLYKLVNTPDYVDEGIYLMIFATQ